MHLFRRLRLALLAAATGALVLAPAVAANAHSLDSSTISLHVTPDSVDAAVSVPLEAVDAALGSTYADDPDLTAEAASRITDYLDEHLTVTGTSGAQWADTYGGAVRETVEGIESLTVDVAIDPAGADTGAFTLAYDAIVESVPAHEAVVVLTDANGDVSTAGVLDAATPTLGIGGSAEPGPVDMVGYGFHHVLEGADHLLFLLTLLLVAPLAVAGKRWVRREGALRTGGSVLRIVTAFTLGHSLTLLASALGWVSLPTEPIEVLIAVSVGVSALHAIRPLARNGEEVIAVLFGLVHGLAFAGILADLGLAGTLSVPGLLAFNVGVELAQLGTVALVFPSLYALSRTRYYPPIRVGVAVVALVAAGAWAFDRLGVLANPIAGMEDALVARPLLVVAVFAAVAACCAALEWRASRRPLAVASSD